MTENTIAWGFKEMNQYTMQGVKQVQHQVTQLHMTAWYKSDLWSQRLHEIGRQAVSNGQGSKHWWNKNTNWIIYVVKVICPMKLKCSVLQHNQTELNRFTSCDSNADTSLTQMANQMITTYMYSGNLRKIQLEQQNGTRTKYAVITQVRVYQHIASSMKAKPSATYIHVDQSLKQPQLLNDNSMKLTYMQQWHKRAATEFKFKYAARMTVKQHTSGEDQKCTGNNKQV